MLSSYNNTYKAFDTSIKNQGLLFLKNENTYKQLIGPNLKLINESTIPNLNSIKEALESQESSSSNSSSYNSEYSSELENQFNRTLQEYNTIHKQINEDLLKKEQSKNKIKNYLGKVITEDDSTYRYVNNYGYTHRYSTDAWSNNDKSCPSDPINVNNMDDFTLTGAPMGIGQPCNIAGKNIKNETTEEIAWVDIKGYKHVYSNDIWNEKKSSCNINPITISNALYNAIPTGNPMTNTYICNKIDVNPNLWKKLIDLNKKLKGLAYKILKEIEELNVKDDEINKIIIEKRNLILSNINEMDDDRKNIYYNERQLVNIHAEKEDSELVMTSFYYRYIFWFIIMIMILITTARYMSNIDVEGDLMVISVTVVIGILIILYKKYNIS
jgi:hypothetical protein